jgi:hypothetical protein
MDRTMKDLEERKERWKELCDPSDADDLSSERGDSDQPDIYKPPLEIHEGDVRDHEYRHTHSCSAFPFRTPRQSASALCVAVVIIL